MRSARDFAPSSPRCRSMFLRGYRRRCFACCRHQRACSIAPRSHPHIPIFPVRAWHCCAPAHVLCTSWQDGYTEPPQPTQSEKVRQLAAQIVERGDAEKAAEEASSQAFAACGERNSNQHRAQLKQPVLPPSLRRLFTRTAV